MKRTLSIVMALAVLSVSATCYADTVTKFKSGVRDVMMSPLQVSDNVKMETKDAKFLPFALVGGLMKGSFYMAKQIVTGSYCIVTSPIDMMHK